MANIYSISGELTADQIASILASGALSPKDVVDLVDDSELVDDCVVLDPSIYHVDDGNAEMEYEVESGEDAAQEYVDGGDWGDETKTRWITVRTWRNAIDSDGDACEVDDESHTIAIEPEEPECCGDEHCWTDGSVRGHGGGVTHHYYCRICGCGKVTDTWAHNPETGEQGLESVEYIAGEFADKVREQHIRRAVEALGAKHYDGVPYDLVFSRFANIDEAFIGVDRNDEDLVDYGIALLDDEDADAPASLGTYLDEEEVAVVCA